MDEVISAMSEMGDLGKYTEIYPDAEKYVKTESFHRVDMWW
ncbi:PIG-L domain-containing protein [Dehalococcoides mccartyi]|nr:PIG-L domain-containing protein [Dehalococcoides mccartyi]